MQNEWIVPKKARLNAVCTSCLKCCSSRACRVRCCISSAARLVKVTTTRRGKISAAFGERAIDKMRSVIAVVLPRSEEHTSELQSRVDLVCRLLLEKKKNKLILP